MHTKDLRYILVVGCFFIICNAQQSLYSIIKDRKFISRSDEAPNRYPNSATLSNQDYNSNVRHFSPYGNYENSYIDNLRSSPHNLMSKDEVADDLHQEDYSPFKETNPIDRTALFRHHNRVPPLAPGAKPKPKPPRVIEIFGQNDVVDLTQVVITGFNIVGLVAMWILILWWNGWDALDVLMGDNFNWHSRQLQGPPSLSEGGPMQEITSFISNIMNKADYIDLAFTTFGVTDKECMDLAICKLRQYIQYTPLVNTLVENAGLEDMSIFQNYKYAMEMGMNNTSCENMFELCQNI